ncbi:extracellular catalytic domain type 2 short-chain-length polyhydroxyalkanoate depolymerase [Azospirillum halopraeferens]|uniref:extracellular catalytic domain type 2 short-chain-length polyhydroxyalkanoate depolymerase n=1 Tax=Azospirillum halopraeferens TaxID=34010 RepID=UPI00040B2228|nr:hypothetical protein [Azospirillum halopraeferens]
MGLLRLAIVLSLALLLPAAAATAAGPVPALRLDPSQVSVSGLSAGAFMAMQMHVAHSESVIGAGIVAGGPYFCAGGEAAHRPVCRGVAETPPNARHLYWSARGLAAEGEIDPLETLRRTRVYLFSGTVDDTVTRAAMDAVRDFYRLARVPEANLEYVSDLRAGHGFLTPDASLPCTASAPPHLNRCLVGDRPYDMAGAILERLHGPLKPPSAELSGRLLAFDQRAFADAFTGLADTGHLYVPADCPIRAGCRLHIAFHGCPVAAPDDPAAWHRAAGYNRWADANRIVVLYPRVQATAIPYNPDACWDWWGYTGPAYATRAGAQIAAVMQMVVALTR